MATVQTTKNKITQGRKKWPWVVLGLVLLIPAGFMLLVAIVVMSDLGDEETGSVYVTSSESSYALGAPSYEDVAVESAAGEFVEVTSDLGITVQIEQKVVKTAELSVVVNSTLDAVNYVTNLADQRGGFVVSSETYLAADESLLGSITVRIPADQFEETVTQIKQAVELVESETVTGVDVTEEYIDLQSRLKNAQALEASYAGLLERSGSIDDLVKVTKQLGLVREEIEILQGRIRYIESRTDFSTITVQLRERPSVVPSVTERFDILLIFQEAFQVLVLLGRGVLVSLIWLVVLGGPIFILFWIVWKLARGKMRHAKKQVK